MDTFPQPKNNNVRATLEHLTGPMRGAVTFLIHDYMIATVNQDRNFQLSTEPMADETIALVGLSWSDGTYMLEAPEGQTIWVNGRKVQKAELRHGDMIEFGEKGPMSRYRLCSTNRSLFRWTIGDVIGDSLAYMRSSRKPVGSRASRAVLDVLRRCAIETTLLFRVSVILSLLALAGVGYLQYQSSQYLKVRLAEETMRVEGVIATIAQTQQSSLKGDDLRLLREELNLQLTTNTERLAELERRSGAAVHVIARSLRSVAFIQGGYGLRQATTNKLLRYIAGPEGKPLITAFGQPMLSPDGNGDPFEFQFSGTGFLLTGGKSIVTNRHVVQPWENNEVMKNFVARGYTPEMLKMVVYLPNSDVAYDTLIDRISDQADLAILQISSVPEGIMGLSIANEQPEAGDEVILMGYPTGLRSLLAQAGAEFIKSLEKEGEPSFWSVAARLASLGKIQPLASRGIVGHVAPESIVYDAETTHGGSGGPVLDYKGHVVAINTAILPEFGGSNMGVPAAKLRKLLEQE